MRIRDLSSDVCSADRCRGLVRVRASAGPAAGGLGGGRGVEELHVLRPRQPRRAAGTAVHAGGAHGVDEAVVRGRVAGENRGTAHRNASRRERLYTYALSSVVAVPVEINKHKIYEAR